MVYLALYLLYMVGSGLLLTNYKTIDGAQYAAAFFQLVIYSVMYLYWKRTYDKEGIKQKVIEQNELPMHKRQTLIKPGNWGFLVLIYFVSQTMSESMITPVYYISTILDFILIFFVMYPLVIESNLGFKKSGAIKVIVMGVVTVFLALFFNIGYNMIVDMLQIVPEAGEVSVNQQMVVKMILTDSMRSFMMITFSAAIVEEWLFRGLGFRTILHHNRFLAYVVTFVVFSLPHLLSGFVLGTGLSEFIFMPVYGMMGVFFAFSYDYTQTIYTPMLAHFLNNLLSFVSILFASTL